MGLFLSEGHLLSWFFLYQNRLLGWGYRSPRWRAYQVILETGIGQFRGFESPRVHTRINWWGLFLVYKLTCGKLESVS